MKINVLVLAAGEDAAFHEAGYRYPKNLIEIDNRPLLQHVHAALKTLSVSFEAKFHFLVRSEEIGRYHTDEVIRLLDPNAIVIEVHDPTGGAACTALLAIDRIENEECLLICNGDVILDTDIGSICKNFQMESLDGGAVVFDAIHPRWSYVKVNKDRIVTEAAEKRPISRNATAGIYFFRNGKAFVHAAMDMILKDAHVGGAFYVCPVFNEMILDQKRIGIAEISRDAYHSLADPRSVSDYEEQLRRNRSLTQNEEVVQRRSV